MEALAEASLIHSDTIHFKMFGFLNNKFMT